jgi:hypothetical protein
VTCVREVTEYEVEEEDQITSDNGNYLGNDKERQEFNGE